MNKILAITGHYGCGKTNLSANLALKSNDSVTVIDLDIVNPYFRTADFGNLFESRGIKLVAPEYANTNLDIPSFGFDLTGKSDGMTIIDVGGDDAGAVALGRFADELEGIGYELLYVFNCYRYLTTTPEEALTLMREIEVASRLHVTGLVNNSNLGSETTEQTVMESLPFAQRLSELSGLPIVYTASSAALQNPPANYLPIEVLVRAPWEAPLE